MEIVEGEATHVVDIPGILAKMEDRISKSNQSLPHETRITDKRCIFRLPRRLKNINGKSLEPQAIALGPYHHGKPQLQMMEEFKWRCLNYFMRLAKVRLEECLIQLGLLEKEVRECYSETINLSSDKLLQMMVVDGCFILLLFVTGQQFDSCNPLYSLQQERVILSKIYGDLLLLENQIPSFVLEELYRICFEWNNSLFVIAIEFLWSFTVSPYSRKMSDPLEWMHLLDLFRLTFTGQKEKRITYSPISPIPCVMKLCRVGIKVNRHMANTFLDVKFKNGVIQMPDIILDDAMCSLLVNCVVFEQSCNVSKCFSIYAMLLDCLVNTARDIDYLCDRRVIDNFLGTDAEAAQFINNLGKDLTIYKDREDNDYFLLLNVFGDVNEYYQKKLNWGNWQWTSFKREYFGKPWLLISASVGFVLLVLTFLQTYYTIYAYVHPKN